MKSHSKSFFFSFLCLLSVIKLPFDYWCWRAFSANLSYNYGNIIVKLLERKYFFNEFPILLKFLFIFHLSIYYCNLYLFVFYYYYLHLFMFIIIFFFLFIYFPFSRFTVTLTTKCISHGQNNSHASATNDNPMYLSQPSNFHSSAGKIYCITLSGCELCKKRLSENLWFESPLSSDLM